MIKWCLAMVLSAFAVQVQAAPAPSVNVNLPIISVQQLQDSIQGQVTPMGLNWTVGDTAKYNLTMGSFVKGTMVMTVSQQTDQGYWLDQDVDLGFLGKQKVQVLIDKNTGKILKMKVNGQDQTPPAAGDTKVIDMHDDTVTVPAGTFNCVYIKTQDSKNQTSEAWVNSQTIPVTGMIKSLAPGQFGQVTIELTSYEKK